MGQLGMLFASGMLVGSVISTSFALALVVYLVARWRSYRENLAPDAHLGLKTALGLFSLLAFQIGIYGVATFVWGLVTSQEGDGRGDIMREAFGLLVPAAGVYAVHYFTLLRTNAAVQPLVPRLFAGVNLLMTGVIAFAVLLVAFGTLFERGESGEPGRRVLGLALVYPLAWALLAHRFLRVAAGASPVRAVPVPPPAVPPPQEKP
jgi:hypothetical protein